MKPRKARIKYLTVDKFNSSFSSIYDSESRWFVVDEIEGDVGYKDICPVYHKEKLISKISLDVVKRSFIFSYIRLNNPKDGWYHITTKKGMTISFVKIEDYIIVTKSRDFNDNLNSLLYLDKVPRMCELDALRKTPKKFINKTGEDILYLEGSRLRLRDLGIDLNKAWLKIDKELDEQ